MRAKPEVAGGGAEATCATSGSAVVGSASFAAGDEAQRAVEAGGVAGGEELLGVGAGPAGAAELLRHAQRQVEAAIGGLGAAGAAAAGGHCIWWCRVVFMHGNCIVHN